MSEDDKNNFINLFKYNYFELNLKRSEVLDKMQMTIGCLKHIVNKYHLQKDKQLIQKNIDKTCLEKYGRTGWSNQEKAKRTKLERYGNENYNNREKCKQTCLERYGGPAPACDPQVMQKIQQTCIDRYGVPNVRLSESHKQVIKEKMSKTIEDRYGIPWFCLSNKCVGNQGKTMSKINQRFAELLNKNGIYYQQEFIIENKSFDFKIDDILIEIDPSYTHNSTIGPYIKDKHISGKDINYHLNKSQLAEDYNFRCIHIFDWDNWNKVINLITPKQKIFARQCSIKEVSIKECNEFLNNYHLQNSCKNQQIRYGLYHNDELIELMTFGKPRYNKNYEWELLRLCSHKDYKIVGGSEKLFKHFLKEQNPQSIISYCDNSKFSGEVYKRLGMTLNNISKPVGNWYNMNTKQLILDSLLRQRGYDQLFGTSYGKGTSNSQLMIEHGFVQIYNCGQKIFIYKIKI